MTKNINGIISKIVEILNSSDLFHQFSLKIISTTNTGPRSAARFVNYFWLISSFFSKFVYIKYFFAMSPSKTL